MIPYSVIPAAFASQLTSRRFFSALIVFFGFFTPFIFIIVSFQVGALFRFYPLPQNASVSLQTFTSLLVDSVAPVYRLSLGLFHVPLAFFVIGVILLFKSKRLSPILIIALALCLALYKPALFMVPPAFWLSIVVLVFSITVAIGFSALLLSGSSDSFLLLLSVCVSAFAVAVALLLAKTVNATFLYSAQLHGLGVLAVLTIFFISRAGLTMPRIRLLLLGTAAGIDVIMTANHLMRGVF